VKTTFKPLDALTVPARDGSNPGGSFNCSLRGRDMLCFSHDWRGDPLSKTHLMRLLARENRVLWVNSIGYRTPTMSRSDLRRVLAKLASLTEPLREVEPNIFVLNPFALPFYGEFGKKLNRRLLRFQVRRAMRRLGFQRPVNWVFNPAASVIAGELNEDLLIYYCVDEYAAFAGVSRSAIAALEHRLLERADLVIVSAAKLFQSKVTINPRTALVRHGVDYSHFCRALDPQLPVPEEIARLPRPVIGYFGLIAQDWVDVPLMEHVAKSFPEGSVVMLGKVMMDVSRLQRLPNVHLLGRRPYLSLPAFSKGFDVAVIPFPISEVTLNANPLKAREYLAAGLPVVSTAIPEVQVLEKCYIGGDHDSFVREIQEALREPRSRYERSKSMASDSWESRLAEIEQHLDCLDRANH
jgi:glycosyltransferase involved in cell wall biosynthesis